ncbi:peptidyl-prolyl cis-trans isomerase sig-7-like [Pollicipes pollicipes]|uniref:peptidyl-prolyl cis-trans isomerase sig-7-like n=1 Tax=Pollicipes pollicipes TaxID=41117 RepID=UPI00188505D1|nr:peptidyl-prolyl cis-trans isomerase sig-7-like [Pollicipes pollicipes]
MSVVIETTVGDLTVDLFLRERPRACQNFLKLCKLKYYNFCLFHTIQRDFIAQTGDPAGTGKGGTSLYGILYGDQARYFEAEKMPKLKHRNTGTLSFASHGGHMLGSQFFVTLSEDLEYLDDEHCVFGQVVEGHDVLVKLNSAICDEKYQPYQDIRVTHTVILDDPLDDPDGLEIPDRSPPLTDDILKSGRIAADEDLDEDAGRTAAELDEMIQQREAQARATILEMVGDLPDADTAPPENVLFICKLNPVTTDDDLQVIFSRFGTIVSCEIIRDQKTGNSLQYGFIEFDNPKSCENAYFKMDNVLIDDRRIHVDFSQSVSRVQWRGKGRVVYQNGTSASEFANYGGGGGGGGRAPRGPGGGGGGRGAPGGDRRGPDDRHRGPTGGGRSAAGRHGASSGRRGREPEQSRRLESAAGRLDVGQLRALVERQDRKRSGNDGSKEPAKSSKKSKKHKKRSRQDNSSDSEASSDAEKPAAKSKHRGVRTRSSSSGGSRSPLAGSSRDKERARGDGKARSETSRKKKKHKEKGGDSGKGSKKKRKKHRRHSSTSGSDGTSSSEEGVGSRERTRKRHRK